MKLYTVFWIEQEVPGDYSTQSRTFKNRKEAISFAEELDGNSGNEVYVFDGIIIRNNNK